MKGTTTLLFVFFAWAYTQAQEITFNKDIAPIVYDKCASCHRPGEIGPFSLTNYQEVKEKSSTIKYVTGIRFMPPWKPDTEYNHLLGETALSQEEIDMIAEWVDNGAPEGTGAITPFPQFPDGSLLGEPDLVLTFPEAHLHVGNNRDEYRYFVLPTGLTEDKVVKAIELRPGNGKIVHHCLFFEDVGGRAARADAATPEMGFDAFNNSSGFGIEQVLTTTQYPGYVPGQKPRLYPDGFGQTLSAGSDLVLQMHYAPWPVDEYDQSTVNIFFADDDEVVDRFIEDHVMVPLPGVLINGPFIIPANTSKRFHGVWKVPKDISLVGVSPHMHLLGQDWEVYLKDDKGERQPLISIPEWDFNWQGMYYFNRLIVAKEGWEIHASASYDNTSENPSNPSNPPKFVTWGEGTEDEMYYLPLIFSEYKAGDENIVFDSTYIDLEPEVKVSEDILYGMQPNLVTSGLHNVQFGLVQGKPITLSIYDVSGRKVRTLRNNEFFNAGTHTVSFNTTSLAAGIHYLHLSGEGTLVTEKFVKVE